MDNMRNEFIRGAMQVGRFGEKERRGNTRGKTEVVCTCTDQQLWIYWETDAEDGATIQERGNREGLT